MHTRDRSSGLRRKLFMLYHRDGLLDLAAGMTVLLLAAVFAFEAPAFIGLIGIPMILYIPLKESLTVPRLGYIRFEAGETSRRKLLGFLLTGAVLFIVFLFVYLDPPAPAAPGAEGVQTREVLVFMLLLAGALAGAGSALSNPRFYYYAAAALPGVLAAGLLGARLWIPVCILGIVMETTAVYQLAGFLREYPLTGEE